MHAAGEQMNGKLQGWRLFCVFLEAQRNGKMCGARNQICGFGDGDEWIWQSGELWTEQRR